MKQNLFEELSYFHSDKGAFQPGHFLIRSVQASSTMQHQYLDTDGQEYFSISLLYKGKVSFHSEGEISLVKAPAILLREKGEMSVDPSGTDCQMISLHFSQEFLESEDLPWNRYLNRVFVNSVVPLTENELKDFHNYISLIVYEFQKNDTKAPGIIANLLMIVFKMIINRFGIEVRYTDSLPASRLSYFQFKTLIEQHFKRQHHVQAYADQLCMTAEMLGKVVKDTVNKTPKQVIDDRLITEAKRMLAWTRISNKEIAYQLGFESDSYFNRYFKKHCHQTPLNFRQQQQIDKTIKYSSKCHLANC